MVTGQTQRKKMTISIVERDGSYILGRENRAEELIEWSTKGAPGQRWLKEFPFGMRLGFVRDGLTPKMYIHWNQHKFNTFLKTLGAHEAFSVTAYGIRVSKRKGHTTVKLLGGGLTTQVLWDTETIEFSRQQEQENVNWLVGMVRFTEDGPTFCTQPESQLELEESTAVAIISNKPPEEKVVKAKLAGEVIVKQPALSDKARSYLLQDVAINTLLGRMAR